MNKVFTSLRTSRDQEKIKHSEPTRALCAHLFQTVFDYLTLTNTPAQFFLDKSKRKSKGGSNRTSSRLGFESDPNLVRLISFLT